MGAHNGGVEAQNGARRVYRPVVADLCRLDEEQDPDPHQSEKSDPGSHQSGKRDPDLDPYPHHSDSISRNTDSANI